MCKKSSEITTQLAYQSLERKLVAKEEKIALIIYNN